MDTYSPNAMRRLAKDPIAIIGVSCRFPGISNLDDFWDLLLDGKDTIEEIKRWDIDKYFDSNKDVKNRTHQRHSSLFDKIDDFDPLFFNISPAEAAEMTPSQKLVLELAWESVENSSIPFDEIMGEKAGVYIGNIWNDFEHHRKHKNAEITLHSSIGQSSNVIANRVSYFLGLTGPSLVVDTGCSTSLVALHLACQGLWEGNIKYALAGGVNHILDPDQNLLLSKFGGLSAKGKCSTFDEGVDGFVRGEGAGLLLLKRLSDAERDGDHIYSVIRGTAMNNNGFNTNLPATSTKGQLDVLKEAYTGSGILPSEVHFVETHGTGTKLGDPTECNAIGQFFGPNRPSPLVLGSVKTNLGHTEAAAGVAGLIKTVLAINERQIPKNLNFENPNPEIDFDGLNLKVQSENSPWPVVNGETRKAGVNSFGWGGTNAHVVIEEYRAQVERTTKINHQHEQLVLPLSAKSEKALEQYISSFRDHFIKPNDHTDLSTAVISTAMRKPKLSFGKLFAAKTRDQMVAKLEQFLENPEAESSEVESSKVVFVFPGQGSQWVGMGKELYEKEPIFRQVIEECEKAFHPYTNWSLTEQMYATDEESRLDEICVIQPYLFAMQIALAKLWISCGVTPDAVVGHSMGEVASSYISGSLSLNDAANVICTRSRLMQTVSGKGGAMAVTELTITEAENIITDYEGLSIAVNNSPKSTVIAGGQKEISRMLETLESQGLFCKQVKVDVASHSSQMDPLKDNLKQELSAIEPKKPSIKLYSTVRNTRIDNAETDADYWCDNLRSGVQFASIMEQLIVEEHTIFVEVSPHPVLVTAIQECVEAFKGKGVVSLTLLRNKPETQCFYDHFGELYSKGLHVNWSVFYNKPSVPYCPLPGYPFQRAAYSLTEGRQQKMETRGGHVLIGKELDIASVEGLYFWKTTISTEEITYLSDYKIGDRNYLPTSFCIEMIHAAVAHVSGSIQTSVTSLHFNQVIGLANNSSIELQLKLSKKEMMFELLAYIGDHWVSCVTGSYNGQAKSTVTFDEFGASELQIDASQFYSSAQQIEYGIGSSFKNLTSITLNGNCGTASIEIPKTIESGMDEYFIHPTILEPALHALFAFHLEAWSESSSVPQLVGIEQIIFLKAIQSNGQLVAQFVAKGKKRLNSTEDSLLFDMVITNEKGDRYIELIGIQIQQKAVPENLAQPYQVVWQQENINISDEKFLNVALLVEEENHLSDALAKEIQSHESNVTVVQMKNSNSWSGLVDWETIEHLVYFANAPFDDSELDINSTHILSRIFRGIDKEVPQVLSKVSVITHSALPLANLHINLNQTPVSGLVKVLDNEYQNYQVSHIDSSILPTAKELRLLGKMIIYPFDHELQIVLRGNQTFLARLEKMDIPFLANSDYLHDGCHILIGADEQSISVIDWMFDKGATYFYILCEPLSLGILQYQLQELVEKGATIEFHEYSRREPSSIRNVLEDRDGEDQIASLLYFDKPLTERSFKEYPSDSFTRQIKIRANEAWLVHQLSRELAVNHLVLFASESALLGYEQESLSASTGSFLQGLAAYRSQIGFPTSTFHLPSSKNAITYVEVLDAEAQAHILSSFFSCPANGVGVFKLNSERMLEGTNGFDATNFTSNLGSKDTDAEGANDVLEVYHEKSSTEDKVGFLQEFLLKAIAKIIKSPVESIYPKTKFKHLGIDSLMAVQFKNRIEKSLHLKLLISSIWEYSTAEELSQFLHFLIADDSADTGEKEEILPVFFTSKPTAKTTRQLICFHDAGGSASLFEDWTEKLGEQIQLIRVELPGRRGALEEISGQVHVSKMIHLITDGLIERINKPTIFIGHSMGGLFAFEVIHELKNRKIELPHKLFISSTPQLNSYDRSAFDSDMSDELLLERFPYLHPLNTPDEELRAFLKYILKMDLALLKTFKYVEKEKLALDITCIRGLDDPTVSKDQMVKWDQEISGEMRYIERKGGHHYIKEHQDFVTGLILDELESKKELTT